MPDCLRQAERGGFGKTLGTLLREVLLRADSSSTQIVRRKEERRSDSEGTMDDYEMEERKQAAADALYQYSQFVMACIGLGVDPSKLRLHLMKEVSGMPTCLKRDQPPPASQVKTGEPSSSSRMEGEN